MKKISITKILDGENLNIKNMSNKKLKIVAVITEYKNFGI